jgi:small subunit ribosomal protein S20
MPQRRNAVKALKKDRKRNAHNVQIKNQFKKAIKELKALIQEKKIAEAKKSFSKVASLLGKAAKKNILHKNTAARKISRLQILINKANSNN